ncbi:MAG: thioredoxin [Siphonobacter sp.]
MRYLTILFCLMGFTLSAQTNLDVEGFEAKMKTSPQLLDVRTVSEYERGYLPNAHNADWRNQTAFAESIKNLDKNQPVLVYCYSGGRSAQAATFLANAGFKEVYNLEGGFLKWTTANKAIVQPKAQLAAEAETAPPNGKMALERSLKENKVVLVDFYADWCGPCKQQAPILEKLKKEWTGKVAILKIDADHNANVVKAYQVDAIPTMLLMKDGKVVHRIIGFQDEQTLKKKVEKSL